MNIKINLFNSFVFLILLYGSFQYGRVYDTGTKVNQPEYNHVVRHEQCEVVCDTSGNVFSVWYKGHPYTLDTSVTDNL